MTQNNFAKKQDNKVVVSDDAAKYFKEKSISSKDWVMYCKEIYDLGAGDIVFYEGNKLGYIKVNKNT